MHRLKSMQDRLIATVQGELNHLDTVDAQELGEAVDMIKDLSEAMYYCTITKAMEEGPEEYRDMDKHQGRMYYTEYYNKPAKRPYEVYAEREYPLDMHDSREGHSPHSRRMYMEAKELHQSKEVKMKELEKYMQELSRDITEMIEDASPEEKQLLYKKMTTLATKINNV